MRHAGERWTAEEREGILPSFWQAGQSKTLGKFGKVFCPKRNSITEGGSCEGRIGNAETFLELLILLRWICVGHAMCAVAPLRPSYCSPRYASHEHAIPTYWGIRPKVVCSGPEK